jgi:hypothetical protein
MEVRYSQQTAADTHEDTLSSHTRVAPEASDPQPNSRHHADNSTTGDPPVAQRQQPVGTAIATSQQRRGNEEVTRCSSTPRAPDRAPLPAERRTMPPGRPTHFPGPASGPADHHRRARTRAMVGDTRTTNPSRGHELQRSPIRWPHQGRLLFTGQCDERSAAVTASAREARRDQLLRRRPGRGAGLEHRAIGGVLAELPPSRRPCGLAVVGTGEDEVEELGGDQVCSSSLHARLPDRRITTPSISSEP